MQKTIQIRVTPDVAYRSDALRRYVTQAEGMDARTLTDMRIRRRSIDARQRTIYVNLTLDLYINEPAPALDYEPVSYRPVDKAPQVIVVGAGPGGLFAALRLIELGLRPVVLERGKDVHARRRDIAQISRTHKVDPESNYSFGEGEQEPFPTANFIRAAKNVETWKNSARLLPARGLDRHSLRRPPSSGHRPPAAHH